MKKPKLGSAVRVRAFKHTFVIFFLCFPTALRADCGALQPLVLIHDSYRAILSDEVPNKRPAADLLLRLVPIYNAEALTRTLEGMNLEIDSTRLNTALVDGFLLARDANRGRGVDIDMQNAHERNASWLTDTLSRSGCFRDAPKSSVGPGAAKSISNTSKSATRSSSKVSKRKPQRTSPFDWRIVAAILLAITLIGLGFVGYRSRTIRKGRVLRQPRKQLALVCEALIDNEISKIIFLDISVGGAKVEWSDPPAQGSDVVLKLPIKDIGASIMWSNAFYAGLMFDKQLSEAEVTELIEHNNSRTRSQLTSIA